MGFKLILFLLSYLSIDVETEYKNRFQQELDKLREDLREDYKLIENCVDRIMTSSPLSNQDDIKNECLGGNFSILNQVFREKLRSMAKYYEWSLMDQFIGMETKYPEEIEFFIDIFKNFVQRGMHDLIGSMESAKTSASYHSDAQIFEELLIATKSAMEFINDLHKEFLNEKISLRKKIQTLLDQRDAMLATIQRSRQTGESLEDASQQKEQVQQVLTPAQEILQLQQEMENMAEDVAKGQKGEMVEEGENGASQFDSDNTYDLIENQESQSEQDDEEHQESDQDDVETDEEEESEEDIESISLEEDEAPVQQAFDDTKQGRYENINDFGNVDRL